MTSVDNRVVQMNFDNAQFEKGVSQSIDSLGRLDAATAMPSGAKGFDKLQQAASNFNADNISSAVDSINSKFSVMGAVGFTAIQRITDSAMNLVDKLGSTTIGQIISGGKVRAQNLEQAYFQFEGLGMDSAAVMQDVNAAVDGTAYSLDVAAKVAAQFGASGMQAGEQMRNSLTAISGVAAMTGTSYEDIGNIFTKVAGQGRLMGDDLLSLSSRGVNAAAVLGQQMGKSEAEVRDMVTKGKISFQDFADAMDSAFGEHATKANETFEGALSNVKAALSRIGAKFFTPYYENARDVLNAIRPLINKFSTALDPIFAQITQAMSTTKEVIVNFLNSVSMDPVTKTFANAAAMANEFYKAIIRVFEIGQKTDDYIQEGPYLTIMSLKHVLNGIGNILANVMNVAKAVGDAFGEVFSFEMLKPLANLALGFEVLTIKLKMGQDTIDSIRDHFVTFFTILKEGAQIVGSVLYGAFLILTPVFSYIGQAASAAATIIGGFIDSLLKARPSVDGLTDGIVGASRAIGDFLANLLDTKDPLGKLGVILAAISKGMHDVGAAASISFGKVADTVGKALSPLADALSSAKDTIVDFFSGLKIGEVIASGGLAALITSAAYQITSIILKLRYTLSGENGAFNIGIFSKINDVLFQLKGTLVAYQDQLKAQTLVAIATAIAILAAAVLFLSRIDPGGLASSVAAMGALMIELGLFMKAVQFVKPSDLIPTAFGISLIGVALNLMADAVTKLSKLDWESLAKGLISVGLLMAFITAMSAAFSKMDSTVIKGAGAMVIIGLALIVMSEAIKRLGEIPFDVLSQGMESLVVILLVLSIALKAFDGAKAMNGAVSMVVIAAALVILSDALNRFGSMDADALSQGMEALVVSLLLLIIAVRAMEGGVGGALAILIISAAMIVLAQAISIFGSIPMDQLIQGMAAFLVILAAFTVVGLLLSPVSLALLGVSAAFLIFSAGLLVAAVALNVMALGLNALLAAGLPSIGMLALLTVALLPLTLMGPSLAITGIAFLALGVGLLATAAAMVLFSAVSPDAINNLLNLGFSILPLVPLAPAMAIVGAALLILGGACLIAAVGIMVMSAAMDMISVSAPNGIDVLQQLTDRVADLAPHIGEFAELGAALLLFGAGALVAGAGALILGAGTVLLGAGFDALSQSSDAGIQALKDVAAAAGDLAWSAPALAAAGAAFTMFGAGALLAGTGALACGAGIILMAAGMDMFNSSYPGAVDGMNAIAGSAQSLADVNPVYEAIGAAIDLMVTGLVNMAGSISGSSAGVFSLTDSLNSLMDAINNTSLVASDGGNSISGAIGSTVDTLTYGIGSISDLYSQLSSTITNDVNNMVSSMDYGKNAIDASWVSLDGTVANGVAGLGSQFDMIGPMIDQKLGDASVAAYFGGLNLVQGFINGANDKLADVYAIGDQIGATAVEGINAGAGNHSPSHKTYKSGLYLDQGAINGMRHLMGEVSRTGEQVGQSAADSLTSGMSNVGTFSSGMSPTIVPVLDLSDISSSGSRMRGMLSAQQLNGNVDLSQQIAYSLNNNSAADSQTKAIQDVGSKIDILNSKIDTLDPSSSIGSVVDEIKGVATSVNNLNSDMPKHIAENSPNLVIGRKGSERIVDMGLEKYKVKAGQ